MVSWNSGDIPIGKQASGPRHLDRLGRHRRRAVGIGPVFAGILGDLLFLHLEGSEINWKGRLFHCHLSIPDVDSAVSARAHVARSDGRNLFLPCA